MKTAIYRVAGVPPARGEAILASPFRGQDVRDTFSYTFSVPPGALAPGSTLGVKIAVDPGLGDLRGVSADFIQPIHEEVHALSATARVVPGRAGHVLLDQAVHPALDKELIVLLQELLEKLQDDPAPQVSARSPAEPLAEVAGGSVSRLILLIPTVHVQTLSFV